MYRLSSRGPLAAAALGFLLFGGVMAPLSIAQTFFGSIVGNVTDPSGAAITNAPVTLTNTGTAERRTAQTDENGNYQFLNLVPGGYKLEVEQSGFRRLTRDEIAVRVDNATRVDVMLQIGDVSQTMEVTSQTAQLQTESATLNQVVEGRRFKRCR